jgi:hypothetical protein
VTKTFLLKGHCINNDTVVMVIEGRVKDEDEMKCEEILGKDFARKLYNSLPSGTMTAMVDELKELRAYEE